MARTKIKDADKMVTLSVSILPRQMKFLEEMSKEFFGGVKSDAIKAMLDKSIDDTGWVG